MEISNDKGVNRDVVLGIDVGTTNIRCYAYDRFANVVGKADEKLDTFKPGVGRSEIVPDALWESFQKVVVNCLIASHLHANEVACMGISTQRGTFLTWNKKTGKPYHNFISWKDRRANDLCKQWNSSIIVKCLRFVCLLLYVVTRKAKFQICSTLKFTSAMVLMRLYWILEHFTRIRQESERGEVLFGTLDTWLLWKLTDGRVHATDSSSACITGFFDPFQMDWIGWILKYFNIPQNILPVVKDSCDFFGETSQNIFGSPIPICCMVGDQQASTFGACCFKKYDVNCTMGTGSFLSVNTGDKPFVSHHGVLPFVGWTIHSETTYIAECGIHETGPFVSWMQQHLGFFHDPSESSSIAQNVSDTGGVHFLPAHTLLENSGDFSTSMFVGLRTNTSKEHIIRAVLESLAFQVCLLFNAVNEVCDDRRQIDVIRMCGGVAKNDFVLQVVSNVTSRPIHRLKHGETSSLGAAFLAGLHFGVWKTLEDISELQNDYDAFYPIPEDTNRFSDAFKKWKESLKKWNV